MLAPQTSEARPVSHRSVASLKTCVTKLQTRSRKTQASWLHGAAGIAYATMLHLHAVIQIMLIDV